jgi:hypothetical protein
MIIRSLHDGRWTASVFDQLNQARREVLAKLSDLLIASASPLVDDLIIIGDSEDILEIVTCKETHQSVLGRASCPETRR